MDNIYVVVGLGNPGSEYELTRHNMGFSVVDALAKEYNVSINKPKFKALVGETKIDDKKIILAKPQTFMNLSGESVKEILDWYKISNDNIIVIYDDIDISFGKLRIRPSGSAGSHNGVKSVVSMLNGTDFKRVRVGIGKPPQNWDLVNYVLGKFTKEEETELEKVINKARDAVKCIIDQDINCAMNKFNKWKGVSYV